MTTMLLLICYFIPGLVATIREHKNCTAIWMLNLLLGWTFLGWIGALVWSLTSNVEETQ